MVGRILEQMMEIDHFPESDRRAFHPVLIRKKPVLDRLIKASTARCVLFKPIADSHRILELMAPYPNHRAFWVHRRWRDVVNSVVNMWGDQWLHVMQDLVAGRGADVLGDWGWRHQGISDDCRETVERFVTPELNHFEATALFWYVRNRIYFDQGLDQRPDVMPVQYEALVTDPKREFARLCAFVDVLFDENAVADVHARSIHKDDSPVGHPGISQLCDEMLARLDGAWERHRGVDA
jgi:hypothetical protein